MSNQAEFAAYREVLASGLKVLPDKPEETAESTLRALWHRAAGQRLSTEAASEAALPALDAQGLALLKTLVERRLSGEPLAHITERQRFMGIELLAGPGALIPRVETELLARSAIAAARELPNRGEGATFIDVCTGSGNIAIALAANIPESRVFAADLGPEAVELARRNVEHVGLQDRVTCEVGDLLAPFDRPQLHGQVAVLTCNPPYISSAKVNELPQEIGQFEPRLAFDGGALGVAIIQRLLRDAPRFLQPGGWLLFEVGLGQGPILAERVRRSGAFATVNGVADAAGAVRVVSARLPG